MAAFSASALSNQKGYTAVNITRPDGTKQDIYPQLKKMGLIKKLGAYDFDPAFAYNTRVGGVVGNKVARLSFDVKLFEDKTADDIASLNVAGFNEQKIRHYETFIFAQVFRKTTVKYTKEDLVDGQKVFGRAIPAVGLSRLMNQRDIDKEVFTFNKLLDAVYHFQNTGIKIWEIHTDGKVKKEQNGSWKTLTVKGTTAAAKDAYGADRKFLKKVQPWPEKGTLSDKFRFLGDINIELTKTGKATSAMYGNMHLLGINSSDIITVMPENVINDLATDGARFPSAMAQKDLQTGNILEGTILGSGYVKANNLPDIDTKFKAANTTAAPKVIKMIKFVRGAFAPLVWISNTGLDAVADYPDYAKESATTHRILEMTNEWSLDFIKEYSHLIYVAYGDNEYLKAATV